MLWSNSVYLGVCQCVTVHVLSLGSLCWVICFVGCICVAGHVYASQDVSFSGGASLCIVWLTYNIVEHVLV